MPTTLLLTRHGHVDWIAPERFRGRADLSLSDLGVRQAEALGQRVAGSWKPEMIYASPLSRCARTAEAVARATGAAVETLPELVDIDYGQWQGLNQHEVRANWSEELRVWLEAPELAAIPGGETLAAVLVRGVAVLQRVLRKHRGQTVVLVGHDSINRVLLLNSLGLPLSRYWRIRQDPCCLNELAVEGETFTLGRINESDYLQGCATG